MLKYYIVDAFTDKLFSGNQAGVCILDQWLQDSLMQKIAAENNLSETAFVVKKEDYYELRWFTPRVEIDLCGHATLGTTFVISNYIDTNNKIMKFSTKSGILKVERKEDLFEMNFPSRLSKKVEVTELMKQIIKTDISEAYLSKDLLLVLDTEEQVRKLKPDIEKMLNIPDKPKVIVTAKSDRVDFVSRFFAPSVGVPEDPVTGSAHTTLIPFWYERLKKDKMIAEQLSERGGTIYCGYLGDRVNIAGYAKVYLEGRINIS